MPHVASERDKTTWCEYFMTTPNGYTNDSVFPSMVAQFEQDFHVRYPDQPALVYADRLSSHTTAELLAATADHLVSLCSSLPARVNSSNLLMMWYLPFSRTNCACTAIV